MSSELINDGGPAFPVNPGDNAYGGTTPESLYGMTLRDWFAGQALATVRTSELHYGTRGNPVNPWPEVAKDCYDAADAMLAARDTDTEADPGDQYVVLSDPTDLKVGDWIQWDNEETPVRVAVVNGGRFLDSTGLGMLMHGHGYTVVPAPKGQR